MFTIPAFAFQWWKLGVGVILGALLCFPLAQCRGEKIGKQKMELAIEKANTKALQEKARADDLASKQRLTDTIAVNRQEKELRDVVATIPDETPDRVRIALGCERLRRSGQSTAGIPACR